MWGGGVVVELIRCFLAIACVTLAADSILVVSDWCDAFWGPVACGLLGLVSWGNLGKGPVGRLGAFGCLCALGGLAFRLDHSVLRVVLVAWVPGLVWLFGSRTVAADGRRDPPCWLALHYGALGYALALAAYERSAAVWFALRDAVDGLGVGRLGVAASSTGTWAGGLPVYVLGLAVLGTAAALGGAKPRHLIGCGGLIAGAAAVQAVHGLSTKVTPAGVAVGQLASVGLVALIVAVVCTAGRCPDTRRPRPCALSKMLVVSLWLTVSVLLVAGSALSPGPHPASDPPRPSFLLYPNGFLDWRVPDFERIGLVNAGMFGLFLRSLERCARASGGKVIMAGDGISPDDLEDVGVVVFINPVKSLGRDEVRAIEEFVRAGGGLLALGDHTNIGGSMEHLNSILAFTGIRFNFDSAVPMRPHWQGCLEVRQHPVTGRLAGGPVGSADGIWGLGRRLRGDIPWRCPPEALLQIAVGASLAIAPPAYPVVVGRYGFQDAGDSLNSGSGAFMGNLVHERGESVGDVVLVAAQQVGRGRVLVFGDTSPFQNGALFLSQGLVSNAIRWLAGASRLCAGDPAASLSAEPARLAHADEVALIDFSLWPRARLTLFDDASLGGLANCLARAGIVAVPAFSRAAWSRRARYLFLVSPARFGRRDADRLTTYMLEGGNVILAQGYGEPLPCQLLLSRFGLAIEDIPLGAGEPGSTIVHRDAWAISCPVGSGQCAPDTIVRASAFGHPTVVTKRLGWGSLTLISDGRFLLDENLEGERRAEPRNLAFVNDLVSALRAESLQPCGSGCEVGHASAQAAWPSTIRSSP
jgi:hypothetical protein